MKCPKCNVDLVLGQAIRTYGPGGPERPCFGGPPILTIDNLSFQFCGKCPKCGFSDDDVTEWADEIIERVGFDKWKEEYGQQYEKRMREEIGY